MIFSVPTHYACKISWVVAAIAPGLLLAFTTSCRTRTTVATVAEFKGASPLERSVLMADSKMAQRGEGNSAAAFRHKERYPSQMGLDGRAFPGAEISGVRNYNSSFASIAVADTVIEADVKLVDCTVSPRK